MTPIGHPLLLDHLIVILTTNYFALFNLIASCVLLLALDPSNHQHVFITGAHGAER